MNPNAPEGRHDRRLEPGRDAQERLGPYRAGYGQILAGHGFQSEDAAGEDYIRSGVNWGYTGAQLASGLGRPGGGPPLPPMLLLILFTGYLIIYNVFRISVTNDIRFYGLLKTIGTTGRQLKRIIRYQALALSLAGIPVGLLLGWLVGAGLTPAVIGRLNGVTNVVSVNPVPLCGLRPVRPGDGAPVLPKAGPDGGEGVPC